MAARTLSLAIVALALAARAQSPGTPSGGAACSSDGDCFGNPCNASLVCDCDAAWTGPRCDLLNLQRAAPDNGLQVPSYFSWGGHAVESGGAFHLFASFMCRHATLGEWTTKSSIWRATSAAPDGPYALAEMVSQPWSHNAMISRASDGTYVLFQIGDAAVDPAEWAPCFNASEAVAAAPPPPPRAAPPRRARAGDGIYARSAPTPEGPWTPVGAPLVFNFSGSWATATNGGNPAPLFFKNGSVLLYFSANPCPPHWGNKVPGNNCIGVARADDWRGPYSVAAANALPVTHPESEDAHVFVDKRGIYHLLTNINNDHARCAAGVACGGHAWSRDGINYSNLTIGAFGPVVRLRDGSYARNAYVERPQVTLAADGVTPLAFFVGVGRTSYDDSATWAQLFCVDKHSPDCGPTLPPPPPPPPPPSPPVRLRHAASGGCLTINTSALAAGAPPCWVGANFGCVTAVGDCAAAGSAWRFDAAGLFSAAADLPPAFAPLALNFDCNSLAPHTPVWAFGPTNPQPLALDGDVIRVPGADACLAAGAAAPAARPCGPQQQGLDLRGVVQVAPCADAAVRGWAVEPWRA